MTPELLTSPMDLQAHSVDDASEGEIDTLFEMHHGIRDLPYWSTLARSALEKRARSVPTGKARVWDDIMFLNLTLWHLSPKNGTDSTLLFADLAYAFHNTLAHTTVKSIVVHNTSLSPSALSAFVHRALVETPGANVSHLTLSFCGLYKVHMDILACYIMSGRSRLQTLTLNHNAIDGNALGNLVRALIIMQGSAQTSQGISGVTGAAEWIGNSPDVQTSNQLVALSLHGNPLGNKGAEYISDLLKTIRLREVNLNFCRIAEEGLLMIAWSMVQASKLYKINLDGNLLTSMSALAILEAVRTSRTLHHVSLNFTKSYCTKAFQRKLHEFLNRNKQRDNFDEGANKDFATEAVTLADITATDSEFSEVRNRLLKPFVTNEPSRLARFQATTLLGLKNAKEPPLSATPISQEKEILTALNIRSNSRILSGIKTCRTNNGEPQIRPSLSEILHDNTSENSSRSSSLSSRLHTPRNLTFAPER